MEVSMGGFRTHKRATLNPTQSTQLRSHSRQRTPPPENHPIPDSTPSLSLSAQTADHPDVTHASRVHISEHSPSPVPAPHKETLPFPTDAFLAHLSYADVRAAQDYFNHYGFTEESRTSSSEALTPDWEHTAPSAAEPEHVDSEDGMDALFDAAAHDIIWGTASPLELLRHAPPDSIWHRVGSAAHRPRPVSPDPMAATPVAAPAYRHTAHTTSYEEDAQEDEAVASVTPHSPSRAIPFVPEHRARPHLSSPVSPPSPTPASPSPLLVHSTHWCAADFDWDHKVQEGEGEKTFAARERRTGFPVEIKCISKEALVLNNALRPLRNEIALQRRVSESLGMLTENRKTGHVQKLYAYFWDATRVFLVLEAVTGHHGDRTMEARLASLAPLDILPEDDARTALWQLLDALVTVHAHGIAHRRVQTNTLLLTGDGAVKLSDFSAAIDERDKLRTSLPARCALDYVAPEVLRNAPWTRCSDMWAVGIVAWRLLCGAVPEPLRSPHDKRNGLAHVTIDYPTHVSAEARDLLQGLLSEIPERRLTASAALHHNFFVRLPTGGHAQAHPDASSTFTPTRALAVPEPPLSPPSPSPSLRPLVLTSILKQHTSKPQRSVTPPASPIPSVSALSEKPSWQECCTPPSSTIRANSTAPNATGAETHRAPAGHVPAQRAVNCDGEQTARTYEDGGESLSVSLSTCSSVSAIPASDGRHLNAAGAPYRAPEGTLHTERQQLSNSSVGFVSSTHANSSWAVSSTTLNVSSLSALTSSAADQSTPGTARTSRGRCRQHNDGVRSDIEESPLPSPAPRLVSQTLARRKLSYSSTSLDSVNTQGISGSQPQPSCSTTRTEPVASYARVPSLSLASLTAITSAVPMRMHQSHSQSRSQSQSFSACSPSSRFSPSPASAASRADHEDRRATRCTDCALQLRFDDSTMTTSSSTPPHAAPEGPSALSHQKDSPQWSHPAPLLYTDPILIPSDHIAQVTDENAEEPKRRVRRVVVLSPLTPSVVCDKEAGLPSFAVDNDDVATCRTASREPPQQQRGALPLNSSFSDSLLVTSTTQPPV